jgi:energy-converting hydrogenase Eha subunit B
MLRAMFIGLPILTLALGLPLALQLVPPNRLYGFRTTTTFSSPEAWYDVNYATGIALLAAGVVGGLIMLLLTYQAFGLKAEPRYLIGITATGAAILLSLIPVVIYSNKF